MVEAKKSLQEWLDEQGRPTSEESTQFKAERKAQEGTMWEWAQMQPNGEIGVRVTDHSEGGGHGIGGFVVKPEDEDYEKAKQEYGLEKPGDTRHIVKRWVGGEWVTERNEKIVHGTPDQGFEQKQSDTAKSA